MALWRDGIEVDSSLVSRVTTDTSLLSASDMSFEKKGNNDIDYAKDTNFDSNSPNVRKKDAVVEVPKSSHGLSWERDGKGRNRMNKFSSFVVPSSAKKGPALLQLPRHHESAQLNPQLERVGEEMDTKDLQADSALSNAKIDAEGQADGDAIRCHGDGRPNEEAERLTQEALPVAGEQDGSRPLSDQLEASADVESSASTKDDFS